MNGPQALRIRFGVSQRDDLNGAAEVVPTIGGEPLTALIHGFENDHGYGPPDAYGGIIPGFFRFGPLDAHYLGRSVQRPGSKVPLLGCGCGEWGCWPLLARVEATDTTVLWSEFEQPFRPDRDYDRFGPFTFARATYDRALTDLVQTLGQNE